MSNSTGFEFIERPSSRSCPSSPSSPNERPSSRSSFQDKRSPSSSDSVTMWVQFEGKKDPNRLEIEEDFFNKNYVADLKSVLCEKFKILKDFKEQTDDIELYSLSSGNFLPAYRTLASLEVNDSMNILVRYPISSVNIKVTLVYGKQGKREIPHTSGSFSFLIAFAKEKFDDLREEEIYFVNDETEILDAYNFNTVVSSQTAQDGNITLRLKVMVKGRKKYSDWNIKDVFRDILRRPDYESLSDMPRFDFEELPPLKHPFAQEEINKFYGELKSHFKNILKELDNEASSRFIINTFLSAAVSHVQEFINDSVRLGFEKELKGSRGYGPIDYVIKIIEIFLVLCEAKLQDMKQGMAQNIVQVHSGVEQQLKSGQTEPKMYGIVTTGKLWRFVRWTGSLDRPVVHVSEEYTCNFIGNLEIEKKMVEYIAQILQDQITTFCGHNNERPSKRLCTSQRNDK